METRYLDNLGGSAQADLDKGVRSKVVFVGPRPVKQKLSNGLKVIQDERWFRSPQLFRLKHVDGEPREARVVAE